MRWVVIVALALASTGIAIFAAKAEPVSDAAAMDGAALFAANCAQCHDKTGWGTRALSKRMSPERAELLRRETIPASFVKHVVRHGIASMPQFTRTDLSDAELDRLADWLETRK